VFRPSHGADEVKEILSVRGYLSARLKSAQPWIGSMSVSDGSGSRTLKLEALWIFKEEIRKAGFIAEFEAHISQPFGLPLHKHRGQIEVDDTSVSLVEGDNRRTIQKSVISGLQVSYDDNFGQFSDSRGTNAPMRFSFGDEEVYIFTKEAETGFWEGKNTTLSQAMGASRTYP
jgi:hypothetical protein